MACYSSGLNFVKVFSISFASALVFHAGLAGVVVLGGAHGSSARMVPTGDAIEILTDEPEAVHVEHVEQAPIQPEVRTSSHGAASPVHVLARVAAQTSALTDDVTPEPQPTQAPPAHFAMSLSSQVGTSSGSVSIPPSVAAGDIVSDAEVTERAHKLVGVAPQYPPDAIAQGVELDSPLPFEIVVDTGGHVERVRALAHAGHGFDEAALAALQTFRFSPATRYGHAVRVRMRWTVDFRLN
jgi:TonB family protein